MEIKKYDKLRKKNNTKDFEGKNKQLDKWLYIFSFFGNVGSVFFAYFLVYPSLLKAISMNLVSGVWSVIISFIFTIFFLVMFEKIKRYLIRNFSHDFVTNNYKLKFNIIGWFIISASIITLSFYLSINGSKSLATTSIFNINTHQNNIENKIDSINIIYNGLKEPYNTEINFLREANRESRVIQNKTTNAWERRENEKIITNNQNIINDYESKLSELNHENRKEIVLLEKQYNLIKDSDIENEMKIIHIFIIIVIFNELIIIGALYFREYYENKLLLINQEKYEKIYIRRDRYRSLIMFIFDEGRLGIGDKVIPSLELKAIVSDKTNIVNPNKVVDEFLRDMDDLGVFTIVGKRRNIGTTYSDAINLIDNFDDKYRILENLK